jgi:hypothetical protein
VNTPFALLAQSIHVAAGMNQSICRCCGEAIDVPHPENPNICVGCAQAPGGAADQGPEQSIDPDTSSEQSTGE